MNCPYIYDHFVGKKSVPSEQLLSSIFESQLQFLLLLLKCFLFQKKMSNQLWASELLRQAASSVSDSVSGSCVSLSTTSCVSVPTTTSYSTRLWEATRTLFAPYGRNPVRGQRRGTTAPLPRTTFWSHRFCALARCNQVLIIIILNTSLTYLRN